MINRKSKKGITLISLVITIVILLILSGTVIYSLNVSNGIDRYNKMVADIKLLNDKVHLFFNKYDETPVTTRTINIDNMDYYEIDLLKLENLTLNYGSDFGKEGELTIFSDVYLVNSNLNVYYLKGIEKSGQLYHYNEE